MTDSGWSLTSMIRLQEASVCGETGSNTARNSICVRLLFKLSHKSLFQNEMKIKRAALRSFAIRLDGIPIMWDALAYSASQNKTKSYQAVNKVISQSPNQLCHDKLKPEES